MKGYVKTFENFNKQQIDIKNSDILKAPNGKPSNLTPEQYMIVRSSTFKNWFGDWENEPNNASKVVDENGEPMVVYHRTDNMFYEFDKTRGLNQFYFSDSLYNYSSYGSIQIEAFINLRNPAYKVNQGGKFIQDGYDGAILKITMFDEHEIKIIATESNQIKLADGSNVNFNPTSNDIRL